jgi:hypothetical protein
LPEGSFYPSPAQKTLKTLPQAPSDPSPATIPLKTLPQASSYPSPAQKPLKTLPQAPSDPSPATNNHQNVAGGLLLSLSGNEYPSKRRRRSPFIPPRQRITLKASPQGAEGTAIRQCDIYFDFILNCFNLGVDG